MIWPFAGKLRLLKMTNPGRARVLREFPSMARRSGRRQKCLKQNILQKHPRGQNEIGIQTDDGAVVAHVCHLGRHVYRYAKRERARGGWPHRIVVPPPLL